MYIERLPSGQYGVYRDDGFRVAICHTREAAKRKRNSLLRRKR